MNGEIGTYQSGPKPNHPWARASAVIAKLKVAKALGRKRKLQQYARDNAEWRNALQRIRYARKKQDGCLQG